MTPTLVGQMVVGAALVLSVAPITAAAQAAMPRDQLRDLTTDRPDTTESPFTIDPGHVQIETTLFGYARAPRDGSGVVAESFEVATSNLRIGLTRALEVDVVLHPYGGVAPGGPARRLHGIGALDLRAKVNIWGNDGGPTALAVLPYVSVALDPATGIGPPDALYGVLVPFAVDLGGRFGLGLNTGLTYRREERAASYRLRVPATASLAVRLSDRVGGYYEVAAELFGGTDASASLNTGLTYRARDTLQFDAGIGFGVAGDAATLAPFLGVTARF